MTGETLADTISDADWGRAAMGDMLATVRRYPLTHGNTVLAMLNDIHTAATGEEAATGAWLSRQVKPNETEFAALGDRLKQEPVLSSVRMPVEELAGSTEGSQSREALAAWLPSAADERAPELRGIETVELRLFTDVTEIAIGWEHTKEGEMPRGWVLRPATMTADRQQEVDGRIEELRGLIPLTHMLHDDKQTLVVSEYVHGEPATDDDVTAFTHELAQRNIPTDGFDLNAGNIVERNGKLLYIDGDAVGL